MGNEPAQNRITGDSAVKIASSIEGLIQRGELRSGVSLPTVRSLAGTLGVSPATVAAAYRTLRARGLVLAEGRRGTRVSPHLTAAARRPTYTAGPDMINLADGNPDPALLPSMADALCTIDPSPRLYGQSPHHPELVALMTRELDAAGVTCGDMCVVSGAMDGIARVIDDQLRPGDRVAVEDPGFTGILDLLTSRGLNLLPVAVDDQGMLPEDLAAAIGSGARAVVMTPRVQSPTGAVVSAERARELQKQLRPHPDVLIVQDDHARLITDAPLHTIHTTEHSRWVYIHSFSKALNPDLRLAVMTGDDTTMDRLSQRMLVTERWVSHILQRVTLRLLGDRTVRTQLQQATQTYTERRSALLDALRRRSIRARAASGYNVWVDVREETATVMAMAEAGWAVSPGERYRLQSPPGIRLTASRLQPNDATSVADALAAVLAPDGSRTSSP